METPQSNTQPKRIVYKDIEEEIKRIEIEKNIYVRLLKINGEMVVDMRRFYREFPTKKGVRISLEAFNSFKTLI